MEGRRRIRVYKENYGEFPTGKGLDIIKRLRGNNPKRIDFLDWSGRATDANGRLLDEWGTPYLISSKREYYVIRSAGPDRQFDTGDRLIERSSPATNIETLQ
jgi:hypothetical protein